MDQVILENYRVSQKILLDFFFLLYCRWYRALKLANKQKKGAKFSLQALISINGIWKFFFPSPEIEYKIIVKK